MLRKRPETRSNKLANVLIEDYKLKSTRYTRSFKSPSMRYSGGTFKRRIIWTFILWIWKKYLSLQRINGSSKKLGRLFYENNNWQNRCNNYNKLHKYVNNWIWFDKISKFMFDMYNWGINVMEGSGFSDDFHFVQMILKAYYLSG